MCGHLHRLHVSFLSGKRQPIFYFQAAGKKKADHHTNGWSRVPTHGGFLSETIIEYTIVQLREMSKDPCLQCKPIYIDPSRIGLFPFSSIYHFLNSPTLRCNYHTKCNNLAKALFLTRISTATDSRATLRCDWPSLFCIWRFSKLKRHWFRNLQQECIGNGNRRN